MNRLDRIQQFQLFCLECYRSEKHISGLSALSDFKKYNVFDYLASGFEVLHTQGKNYLIADINDYIMLRK